MAVLSVQATMSLDGFIADTSDRVGPLFDWYGNGDVEVAPGDPERAFRVSAASADYLRRAWADVKVGIMGRRLFLVPVVFGSGRRYFGSYDAGPHLLGDPVEVVHGTRVTNLHLKVDRPA